jgi:PleD family two-component response regulator
VYALHHALASTGATIVFASDGEEALWLAQSQTPDLILLDIQMPEVDGFEVCRRPATFPALAHLPVVFVTRHSDPALEARALDVGGTDFITKPYAPAVLKARIGNVLRLKEQTDTALRAEREHWQNLGNDRVVDIVGSAYDAILSADCDGNVVLINEAACQMFGVTAASGCCQ